MKTYQRLNVQLVWLEQSDIITLSTDKTDNFNRDWFGVGGGNEND